MYKVTKDYKKRRKEIIEMYLQGLRGVENRGFIKLPIQIEGLVSQYFILQVYNWREIGQRPERDILYDYLKKKGIETKKYGAESLELPINEANKEVDYIIDKIQDFYEGGCG